MEKARDSKKIGPNRTVANSVYYTMPGVLYAGWTTEGSGYIYSMAEVPPFVDVTFVNQMTDKKQGVWYINEKDITEYADENGDYVSNYYPQALYYPPMLAYPRANATYQFNEDNYWVRSGTQYTANDLSLILTYSQVNDDVLMMTATDLHGSRVSETYYSRNTLSGWGYLSTDFLFGSGDVDGSPVFGFEQTYNPLLAPLALDDVRLQALTYNEYGPIPDGGSIKAYVMTIDTETDESTIVATLEALSCDTIDFKDAAPKWGRSGENTNKTAYFGELIFRNTEKFVDSFGKETPLPIAVPAGKVWRIQVEGLNDEGVNLGVFGVVNSEVEASYIDSGYNLTEDGHAYTYQSPISPYVSLHGQYEMIDVVTKDFLSTEKSDDFPSENFMGWNVLRVSSDGKTISTEGMSGTDYDMGCAYVGTSRPWFGKDDLPNYDLDLDNLPDWIEGLQVDTTEYNKDNITGYNLVIPICKPLPSNISGRKAEIEIIGKAGIPGNHKIIVLQGNEDANPYVVLSEDQTTLTFYGNKVISNIEGTIYNFNYVDNKPKWYDKRTSIQKVVFDPTFEDIRPTTTASWFYGMSNLTSIEGMKYLNTSAVTGMSYMFYGCSSLKSIDLNHFNTKNVTLMGYMFLNCSGLESLDVSKFDTSSNTSFYRMFEGCKKLTSLDLTSFIIGSEASTSYMLYGCSGLQNLRVPSSMSGINSNACTNVGTTSAPCTIYAPDGFDFGVSTSGNYFQWKGGYFKLPFTLEMTAESISIYRGSTAKLPVSISNGENIIDGYQFDVVLPEGVSLARDEYGEYLYTLSNRYSGGMSVAISKRSNNTFRVVAFSLNGVVLKGEEGVAITFDLTADGDIVAGDYEGKLENINLSKTDGFCLYPDDTTFNITVKSAKPGDVNHDGRVNVSDVMAVVNYILGAPPTMFFEEDADLNYDTRINVADVMNIVNIILNSPSEAPVNHRITADNIYLTTNGRICDVCLDATESYTACEMTIQLPEGCELLDATLASCVSSHNLLTKRIGSDTYRLVVYAPQGEPLQFSGNSLLRLTLDGNVSGSVKLSDILFTNSLYENIILSDAISFSTGINDISFDSSDAPMYNTQGMKISSPKKGIYIQNSRKIVVK